MRSIYLSLILLFPAFSVYAEQTEVSTAQEINSGSWVPGDTIVMKNGTWTNQAIEIKADGTIDNPIVLMAETPGEVILTGSSKLEFSGKYKIITGLHFKDGNAGNSAVISFRTSSSNLAENCRISNTVIENYNPSSTTNAKWVSIYGKNNRVDHCSFVNKTNEGTLLVVWLTSDIIPNHIIDHNYFGYRIPNLDSGGEELNGQEIIRIGDSKTSMQTSGCIVSNNFFEQCNGEIEIISNKSCENIYSNNIFNECVGMLTLRHGNRCTVEGNYFYGNGISRSGGVRIIGEDHKVYNNYFENLQGDGYRAALCMVRGIENSALNEYFQVKNASVMFNTMVDCYQGFSINYGSKTEQTMPPIGSKIENNHVYNTSTDYTNVIIFPTYAANMDVTWKNNLMNQGYYGGFTPTAEEVITGVDPSMARVGTPIDMYEPLESSALLAYNTNDYAEVSLDIRGRDRDTIKIPGASQLTGSVSREMPTKETTGANYYTPPLMPETNINILRKAVEFEAYAVNSVLYTTVSEPGTLSVYDLSGRCLHQQKMVEGRNITPISARGLLILRFNTTRGDVAAKKIISH